MTFAAYCDCVDLYKCQCALRSRTPMEWRLDQSSASEDTRVRFDGALAVFHPGSSHGTANVKGNAKLRTGMIHYWEVQITRFITGTDLMIGIGTEKISVNSHLTRFVSFLGLDEQSWGFSIHGYSQHAGVKKVYSNKFRHGCLIGVYLDLTIGHMEFYVNRRPQGIAFKNIPVDENISLYPIISSTAANSSVRLISAISINGTLQFQCMKIISRSPTLVNCVKEVPGLQFICRDAWFLLCQEKYEYFCNTRKRKHLELEDEIIINFISANESHNSKYSRIN